MLFVNCRDPNPPPVSPYFVFYTKTDYVEPKTLPLYTYSLPSSWADTTTQATNNATLGTTLYLFIPLVKTTVYVAARDGSDLALTVIQILACLLVILGFLFLIAYFMFTRCLKRRPVAPHGDLAWKCRRATFKCKCFRRRAAEVSEPKEEAVPDEEDQRMQESRRSNVEPPRAPQDRRVHQSIEEESRV